jgi:hypothetical protein
MRNKPFFRVFLFGAALLAAFLISLPRVQAEDSSPVKHNAEFTDVGDGTVTDNKKQLMWQKDDDGKEREWNVSISYCQRLKLAGHSDWRLPTKPETALLWYNAASKDEIRETYFPCMKKASYWSSTAFTESVNTQGFNPTAYSFDFNEGHANQEQQTVSNLVRCVRLGK